ncbi:Gmad2 immunoglobulin-like domain-containing protein [Patescibacteria group bacterium]|jgi:hypothetical protein|nr:Gmad2 immunoglobulin-like domain-containing protein [Patescibacteria group bacterium]
MKHLRSVIPMLAIALLGAGCAPAPSSPASPTPTPKSDTSAKPSEPALPAGTYKSVKGKTDAIRNIQLVPTGETVTSPLIISGEARLWYFEGTFPVRLVDQKGMALVESYASADGGWMTEEWVPFTAELVFVPPAPGTMGKLILMKDNPSGLPENDDRVEIPVKF